MVEPEWYCLDYAAAGLSLAPALQGLASRGGEAAVGREVVDAEAQADADRRARRMVIALNKLGDAAIRCAGSGFAPPCWPAKPRSRAVRRSWQGAGQRPHLITDYRLAEVAADLLGLSTGEKSHGGRDQVSAHLDGLGSTATAAPRSSHWGLVLAGLESRCPKDAWRSGGATAYRTGLSHADYLAFLEANGYVLSDIEQVIVGARRPTTLRRDRQPRKGGSGRRGRLILADRGPAPRRPPSPRHGNAVPALLPYTSPAAPRRTAAAAGG